MVAHPESSVSTDTLSHSRHSPSPTPLLGHSSSSQSPSASRALADCSASGVNPIPPTAGSGRAALSSVTTDPDDPTSTTTFAMHELDAHIPYNTDTVLDQNAPDGGLAAPYTHHYCPNPQSRQQQQQQRQQQQRQQQRGSRSSEDEDGSSSGGGGGPLVVLNPRTTTATARAVDNCGGNGSDFEPDTANSSKQLRIAHSPNTFRSYSNL